MTHEHDAPEPVTEAEYQARRTALTGIVVTERRRWTTAESASHARARHTEQPEPSPRG